MAKTSVTASSGHFLFALNLQETTARRFAPSASAKVVVGGAAETTVISLQGVALVYRQDGKLICLIDETEITRKYKGVTSSDLALFGSNGDLVKMVVLSWGVGN